MGRKTRVGSLGKESSSAPSPTHIDLSPRGKSTIATAKSVGKIPSNHRGSGAAGQPSPAKRGSAAVMSSSSSKTGDKILVTSRSPPSPDSLSSALFQPTEAMRTEVSLLVDPRIPFPKSEEMKLSNSNLASSGSIGWQYIAHPLSQRTFFFPEDNLEFSSEFDSGNLIQMERLGPYRYNCYTAMDCANTADQTNNRQWFHFAVRGGYKGAQLSINLIGVMHCKMFTFDWMPVMAIRPSRPHYQRLPGKAVVIALDTMPFTPGYPQMVYKRKDDLENSQEGLQDEDDDENGDCALPPLNGATKKTRRRRKKDIAMSIAFDFRMESDIPLKSPHPLGHPSCPAVFIASNHPYSYDTLQRHLAAWELLAQRKPVLSPSFPSPVTECAPMYYHREVLCKTLDLHNVELLTISDTSGMRNDRMPLLCTKRGIPCSSATGSTERPFRFNNKLYVVLTARVHPGECPSSHMMHGCIDFLLNRSDPRAAALRQRFVFFIVPMINPDGVIRGHSRGDACGVDLNRMYRNPCFVKHPAPFCIRLVLQSLAAEKKLALFIDMHAHANKKGTFFYGNSMTASQQLQALLYAKLVQLNTAYFEFPSCNFTESNMFAAGKSGKGKDNSSRVVAYLDTGFPLSFTIETSHVAGKCFNPIASIPGLPDDIQETQASTSVRYSPVTFADTGRGLLLALLDMKGSNPLSRIPQTMFHSVRGVTLWLQRQLQVEVAEKLFSQAYHSGVKVELSDPSTVISTVMASVSEDDVPEKMTLRNTRSLPPLTLSGLKEFFSLSSASAILAQTPPAGPPRSLLCGPRRTGFTMPGVFMANRQTMSDGNSQLTDA